MYILCWKPVVKVFWLKYVWLDGPRNQTIILLDDASRNEIRLQCFAEGNPAPDYEWKIVGENISLNNGSILVINESMLSGERQTLRCTARNSVAGQIRSNESTYTLNHTRKRNTYILVYFAGAKCWLLVYIEQVNNVNFRNFWALHTSHAKETSLCTGAI